MRIDCRGSLTRTRICSVRRGRGTDPRPNSHQRQRFPLSLQWLGEHISAVEVTHVSRHGVWLPIGKILNVEERTPGHFYWPDLDVDLGVDSIEHPERFPLKAK